MNKIFIVLLFILLGSSLIVINNIKGDTENSFIVEYQNNKNLALPDLLGKEAIVPNVFRLYNDNGITIDYNINNGIRIINGTWTGVTGSVASVPLSNVNGLILTVSVEIISGVVPFNVYYRASGSSTYQLNNFEGVLYEIPYDRNWDNIRMENGALFNNFQYRVQLEKGSIATSYVVPKLIPIYKDNLTHDEKQQIGMGAFEGIPQIIRTINNILKPVTDFVNGILSIFS